MTTIQDFPKMAQHSFVGTYQDFENYYQNFKKKYVDPTLQIKVVFEVKEATQVSEKKEELVRLFQKTQSSYQKGEGREFTSETLENIITKAESRLV